MPKIIDLSKNIFFLFIIFFINKFSFGQTPNSKTDSIENQLEEVMITGTKTLRVVSSLPLNASVIKKEEIEKTNATRLSDIINEELAESLYERFEPENNRLERLLARDLSFWNKKK